MSHKERQMSGMAKRKRYREEFWAVLLWWENSGYFAVNQHDNMPALFFKKRDAVKYATDIRRTTMKDGKTCRAVRVSLAIQEPKPAKRRTNP